jgi:predicted nuclease of predicted toxin-antitoxin system
MRFLADENVPHPIVDRLRSLGEDVLSVREEMPGSSDAETLDLAARTTRILITEDKEFGELLLRSAHSVPGLIILELPRLLPASQADRVAAVVAARADALRTSVTVIEPTRIRSRPLP